MSKQVGHSDESLVGFPDEIPLREISNEVPEGIPGEIPYVRFPTGPQQDKTTTNTPLSKFTIKKGLPISRRISTKGSLIYQQTSMNWKLTTEEPRTSASTRSESCRRQFPRLPARKQERFPGHLQWTQQSRQPNWVNRGNAQAPTGAKDALLVSR